MHLEEEAKFARILLCAFAAGIGGSEAKRTAQHTLEDWDQVIRVNQTGVFYCMKEELRIMEETGKGNIVNVSSVNGIRVVSSNYFYDCYNDLR